jgi:alkylation response protein AidB-like acyl-CoA dehydrogenase
MMARFRDAPIVAAVRRFVDAEVLPAAGEFEHADRYPEAMVERLRELGLFGALVPAEFGGLGLEVQTYARIVEELCRGWMSLAGVINSHTMAALIVLHHGTDEQRRRFLPRFARGEARGGLCLTEPHAGSDVQAIRTRARRRGEGYVIDGTKMFVTNGREGNTFALLAVTDPAAAPRHRGMSCFIVEKGHPGLRVAKSIGKLGYKGVDTAELVFEEFPVPEANLVGGAEGRGFVHVMSGLETGRINIAARAVGVGQAALDGARAHVRGSGRPAPPALGDMATALAAARLTTYWAAAMKDRAERCDLEAGMAKLLASETAQALARLALGVHGEWGQLASADVERHYRDTPLMIIGEGTNEIQRTLIARQALERWGERMGALVSRDAEPDDRRRMVLAIRQFVDKEIAPVAAEHERARAIPAGILAALADLGVLGALVPAADGGLGLDLPTWAMIIEELARGSATVASAAAAHAVVTRALALDGSREWRARLAAMARGEALGAAALAGTVRARRQGLAWVLTGSAGLVEGAAGAGWLLVRARADGEGPIVAAVPRDAAGLRIGPPEDTLGGRGLDPRRVDLDGTSLPLAHVRGAASGAQEASGRAALALARLGLAATAVGLAQAALESAIRYSQQRVAFGKPICQHQAIQLKLADMATGITAARLLVGHAATALERDADDPAALMARLHAARVAADVTLEAMRVHGGYGYTVEFPVERLYRDAPRLALALGGEEAERAELAERVATAAALARPGGEPGGP